MRLAILLIGLLAFNAANADDKHEYNCLTITMDQAKEYYAAGHQYLDRDNNKIPCDEFAAVSSPPKQQPAATVTATPPVINVVKPNVGVKSVKTKSGKRCKTVKGYKRKNGTRVKSFTRCK